MGLIHSSAAEPAATARKIHFRIGTPPFRNMPAAYRNRLRHVAAAVQRNLAARLLRLVVRGLLGAAHLRIRVVVLVVSVRRAVSRGYVSLAVGRLRDKGAARGAAGRGISLRHVSLRIARVTVCLGIAAGIVISRLALRGRLCRIGILISALVSCRALLAPVGLRGLVPLGRVSLGLVSLLARITGGIDLEALRGLVTGLLPLAVSLGRLRITRLGLGISLLLSAERGPRAGSAVVSCVIRLAEAGGAVFAAIILIHCSYPFKKVRNSPVPDSELLSEHNSSI